MHFCMNTFCIALSMLTLGELLMLHYIHVFRSDTSLNIKAKDTLTNYDMQAMLGMLKKSIRNDFKGLRQ